MFNLFAEMITYPFIMRALIVGTLVSLCAALLGVSLVLKRYSMIGDCLSHVAFGAMAIALVLGTAPLTVGIPIVVLSAFMILRLSENGKMKGDAVIALISSSALAIGVMSISIKSGMNTDICNYMFGSILAMSHSDVHLSIVLSIIVLILFVIFYNKIFAVTFDESFAKATGTNTELYNMLIAALTSITIVIGMRMMGALLISSLIIFPTLSSMRVCKRFKTVIISSAIISTLCFFLGMGVSYIFSTPTGSSIVCLNIIVFLTMFSIGKIIEKR